ncbi:hypothetical protein JCM8547_000785 [Rhodosporidiobolus lusitaniae]
MALGSCCIQGYIHEGTPKGSFEELNGVRTYVALPSGEYDKTKAILFLTDIFGTELNNGKLLADSFAANGFAVYMPDYLNGDPIAKEDMNSGKVQLQDWFKNHGPEQTRPPLDKAVAAIKEKGVTTFGAIGYCLGARYTVDLIYAEVVSVGVVAHPSLLESPKDIEELNKSSAHFLWLNALEDYMFNKEKQEEAKKITAGNDKHKHVDFEGGHGFAIRGDPSDAKIRGEADRAFEEAVNWFKAHL